MGDEGAGDQLDRATRQTGGDAGTRLLRDARCRHQAGVAGAVADVACQREAARRASAEQQVACGADVATGQQRVDAAAGGLQHKGAGAEQVALCVIEFG